LTRPLLAATVAAALVATVAGQRGGNDIGKTPREVLDPKTIKSIQTPLVQRLETEQQSVDRQLARLSGQMQSVVDQLRLLSESQGQIVINTQATIDLQRRVTSLEARVIDDEKSGATDPTNIAVLTTKVDGLVKVGGWLIGTTATLAVSGIVFLIKRLKSGAVVTMKWAEQDAQKQDQSRSLLTSKMEEAIEKTDAARLEVNTINQKIESIGVHIAADHKPLPEKEDNA